VNIVAGECLDSAAVDDRQARIAKNEAAFRATNRELELASQEAGGSADEVMEVLCECGKEGCSGLITLTVAEYDDAHTQEDRFVVLPGHETTEIEAVVVRRTSYFVVDKFGEAEEIAEHESGTTD
jgi:hypothetical protein